MRSTLILALTLAILFPRAAQADLRQDYQQELDAAKSMLGSSVDRARRAIALGPFVGGFGGMAISPNDGVGGFSFGLALYTFDIPTVLDLGTVLEERVKARLEERVKELARSGRVPSREDLTRIAREVIADVKAELFGDRAGKPLEKPGFGVILEGVRLLSPDGWQARLGVSKGIGPVSLGIGGGYQRLPGDNMALLGGEVSLRLTPIGKQRTPVFDVYTRFDVGFADANNTNVVIVGLRALVDAL